jgi:DNA-binding IclR family transcriptional regulator
MIERTAVGRSVLGSAFGLLELVAALEPVRLIDLTAASTLPRTSVYRLLNQLVSVGAVAREGPRYVLGPALLTLGAQVSCRDLREVARRPLVELAAATGAGVALTSSLGDTTMLMETIDARRATGFVTTYGRRVPAGSAMAMVHGLGSTGSRTVPPDLAVDHGGIDPRISCVSCAVVGPAGRRSAVTVLVRGPRMPHILMSEVQATASAISVRLGSSTDHTGTPQ